MSKKINFLVRVFVFGFVTLFFVSCDREFSDIGANVIGDDHYGMFCDSTSTVIAYNQNLGPVQSNNLPINSIGYYKNSVFGKTKASFLTQLQMTDGKIIVYDKIGVSVDSVYLYVPYYSTYVSTEDSGDSTYTLDSIQGDQPIKLSVYRSNFELKDFDPSTGFQQQQRYYSNQQPDVEFSTPMLTRLNNSTDVTQNDEFRFSNSQIKFFSTTKDANGNDVITTNVRQRLAPGMYMDLDTAFFREQVLKASDDNLYNNNNFKNYFKGLYFKAEKSNAATSDQGTLAKMNFAQGKITIVYKDKTSSTDSTIITRRITLNLSGNSLNLLDNDFVNPVTPDLTNGDSELYIKGGDGSMAVIDLFGNQDVRKYVNGVSVSGSNNVPDELDDLRNPANGKMPMINDASLTFYVKKDAMGTTAPEPNRVYLYDLNNNRPLIDYYYDNSTGTSAKYNKYVYGGLLVKSDGNNVNQSNGDRGTKYSIRITNHLRNLILNDSTNVRLGLVVTESIGSSSVNYLKYPFAFNSDAGSRSSKYYPIMSVVNPLGTILYGSKPGPNNPEDKRIKLRIYYTKPE
ncbi:DUF4270 domain-containing protein [Flavobacterium sp. SUN046]|uniref:DUF4270 domain-containing protein n=1 Tax=Flavobacterium sp. SUN046 TaxID=3002440 RepID=UPI002DBE9123|nr:DUF4270 domain-containing protein [Flavobacterium sp. SUN046]MEC4050279.1 DUF4270 domain-containing protein [Flavobacterium sp. SUN046]